MFGTVLVANRGEIAVRVIRTLRALGIGSVAVYSDADAGARHVREADVAVRLGPAPAAGSYLNIGAIVAAAGRTGAQAVHPGYGFLAENAAFARACAAAGLTFIGPPPAAIEAMGDKIRAKATVAAAGVPVVPGAGDPSMTERDLVTAAPGIGFPLLIKPSAGGGGKGMRLVRAGNELAAAIAGARREATAAFGDGTLLLERFIERPRHIEIQVFADRHGHTVHLGERECSLQRRHQKIIEEAPSPLLDGARRDAMGGAATEVARSVGYVGAGTVEFIVPGDRPDDFCFMEMNTRLQVEHPVTELVTGLDLVEWQLRVAAGEPLPLRQEEIRLTGHAVEARVYAEDPARGFLPTGGTVLALAEPVGGHVRTDSGLTAGQDVTSSYDPMLAKVIAWAPDRDTALRRLRWALAATTVLGVTTNIAFLGALLTQPDVVAGRLDTGLVERHLGDLAATAVPDAAVPDAVLVTAALENLLARQPSGPVTDPWDIPDGWRPGEAAWLPLRLACAPREATEVRVRAVAAGSGGTSGPGGSSGSGGSGGPGEVAGAGGGRVRAEVSVGGAEAVPAWAEAIPGGLLVGYGGQTCRYTCARQDGTAGGGAPGGGASHSGAAGGGTSHGGTSLGGAALGGAAGREVLWLGREGHSWAVTEEGPLAARPDQDAGGDGTVRSPMPGTVLAVHVAAGQPVTAGQPMVIVEAMKMEHTVTAPLDGTVTELLVKAGRQVAMDETLGIVSPPAEPPGTAPPAR
jgi:acetyl-CoA/propionyl-CoA carboxylase, biotin carboxylase, biotin carboxyl carrier protein